MKNGKILVFGIITLGVVWLLWPIHSKKYAIHFDKAALAGKTQFLSQANTSPPSSKRPNIVLILADDLGLHDLSLTGNPYIQTPQIDRLAQEGAHCTQAYVSAPVCAPSRAGLMTGRYQHRFGFENQMMERYPVNRLESFWAHHLLKSHPWRINKMKSVPRKKDRKKQGLPPSEITLAEVLKKNCYQTAIIGKWHLGHAKFSLPNNLGFDYHYGFYNSHSLYSPEGTPGIVDMRNPRDWTDHHIWASQRKGSSAMVRNNKVIEEPTYLTHRFAEEATQFIEQNKNRPFFLYVPFSAPHTPLQAPQAYYDQLKHIHDPAQRTYQAMIKVLDDAVGEIHQKIIDLGIEEKTLIFFLSDNGAASYTTVVNNDPLNGGKITSMEGGLRVPFFVKWQGKIPAGSIFEQPVSALDIFKTACAAAGTALPGDRTIDGLNILPFLSEKKPGDYPQRAFFWKAGQVKIVLYEGWKLLFDDARGQSRLYFLTDDPFEKTNLAGEFPKKVEALKKLHLGWTKTLPPAAWPSMATFSHEDEQGLFLFDI